jgi:hypothetical protein
MHLSRVWVNWNIAHFRRAFTPFIPDKPFSNPAILNPVRVHRQYWTLSAEFKYAERTPCSQMNRRLQKQLLLRETEEDVSRFEAEDFRPSPLATQLYPLSGATGRTPR